MEACASRSARHIAPCSEGIWSIHMGSKCHSPTLQENIKGIDWKCFEIMQNVEQSRYIKINETVKPHQACTSAVQIWSVTAF